MASCVKAEECDIFKIRVEFTVRETEIIFTTVR